MSDDGSDGVGDGVGASGDGSGDGVIEGNGVGVGVGYGVGASGDGSGDGDGNTQWAKNVHTVAQNTGAVSQPSADGVMAQYANGMHGVQTAGTPSHGPGSGDGSVDGSQHRRASSQAQEVGLSTQSLRQSQ